MKKNHYSKRIDYKKVGVLLLQETDAIIRAFGLRGVIQGNEFKAYNPTRNDAHLGSFKINLATGKWADFATGDSGGDLISLFAYLKDIPQHVAAITLAQHFGIYPYLRGGAR